MKEKKRIWYQSFVDPAEQKQYLHYLQYYLNDYSEDDFKFEVYGLSPPDKNLHPLTEFRCAIQTIQNAIQAEKEGYDAFVIGHFQEPGINEIKSIVNIPVIGLGESNMLYACSLGRKIGLVTINPIFIPWHENQINHYGLQQRIIAIHAVNAQVQDFERAFSNKTVYETLRNRFLKEMEPMVEQGVEVIILAGGLPMLLLASQKHLTVNGAAVVNGIAVCTKFAELTLKLHHLTGTFISRKGTYAQASQQIINEFLKLLD